MPDINININDVSTEAKQDTQITAANTLNTNVGAQANEAATTDTGSFSIISFIKRGLQNWTALLARIPALQNGKIPVTTSNLDNKFLESFEVYEPNSGGKWTQVLSNGDIIQRDGNTAAASYLVISKDPLSVGQSMVETIPVWAMPFEVAVGLSMSQRTLGQEFSVELISNETPLPAPPDLAISAIQQAASVLTITTTVNHNLSIGMRIGIRDCVDSRMNYPALIVNTTPTPNQFTVTSSPAGAIPSVTAGPFTSGFVFYRSAMGLAPNGTSMIFENPTAANASIYARSESGDVLPSGTIAGNHSVAVGATASVQPVNALGAYSFQPTNEFRLTQFIDSIQWSDIPVDSLFSSNNRLKRTQVVPDIAHSYKFRIRATNNPSLTRPIAQIISAVKTGTTTATITTDVAHGLTTADLVNVYGIRDQAASSFPNLLVATAPASIVSPTIFTIVIGTAATITSYGGYVARVNGGNLMSGLGASAIVASTVARTNNILTLVGNGNWAGLLIGDYVNIVGVRDNTTGATLNVDGAYRIRDIVTTTLVLEPIGTTPTGANIVTTSCGGGVIKRTDMRISYVRAMDFERQRVELLPRPAGDVSNSSAVQVTNTVPVQGTITANQGTMAALPAGTANIGNIALLFNTLVNDVVSAALTTTTTTAAITPAWGTSYQINIPVTAVTGTTPTLDFSIEESDDNGTNWYKVYDFPRITTTGMYRSPIIPFVGNRIRYVQTVAGTSPSFTRAVNRNQSNYNALLQRQLIDRTIQFNTLNSVTPLLLARDCGNATQLIINVGTITTTAPQVQLEGSDDFGATWYSIGTPLLAVASSTVQVTVTNINAAVLRARVSTAGLGVSPGYIMIKAHD